MKNPFKIFMAAAVMFCYISVFVASAENIRPITETKSGSFVEGGHVNFNGAERPTAISFSITPNGIAGTIDIFIDSPYESKGGKKIGSINISEKLPAIKLDMQAKLQNLSRYSGSHGIYFKFNSADKDNPICIIHSYKFERMKTIETEDNIIIAGVDTGTRKGRFQYGVTFRTGYASMVTTETAVVLAAGYRLKKDYVGINVGYGAGATFYERDCNHTYPFDGIPITIDYTHYCLLGKAKKPPC